MTDKDTATIERPTKIFFPKREGTPATPEPMVLDMGEASRLEGFRQNGCR